MAKQEVKSGQLDYTFLFFISDPASTVGKGKTGLVAADLTVSFIRVETDNDVVVTDVTSSLNNLSALTDSHVDWGLKECSATLAAGWYRMDAADAVFAAGAWSAGISIAITSGLASAVPMEFVLVPQAPIDGVLLAPTTHTSAVIPTVSAVTGLTASDVGAIKTQTDKLTFTVANVLDANTLRVGGTVQTAGDLKTLIDAKSSQSSVDDLPTNAELATALGTADDAVLAAIAALNNLSQAGVRSAIGLGSANLDTQLGDLPTNAELATALGTADDAVLAQVALVKSKTDLIPASPAAVGDIPTANANADALLDRANGIETSVTLRGATRAILAGLAGVATGGNTTEIVLKNPAGDTTRCTLTVDADGNRSASTLNV